jgi:hypothetical protein
VAFVIWVRGATQAGLDTLYSRVGCPEGSRVSADSCAVRTAYCSVEQIVEAAPGNPSFMSEQKIRFAIIHRGATAGPP